MPKCEQCGNEYDKTFEVHIRGEAHVYDSFECAVTALAPDCKRCGVRIMGHGVETDNEIFCSAHCANLAGVEEARDRV